MMEPEPTRADLKALLAQHDLSLDTDAEITIIDRPSPDEPTTVLVLDLVSSVDRPDYCTHGYATCVGCGEVCWIGHETSQVLTSGAALPICGPCADKVVPSTFEPIDRIVDHLREDGPHE